VHVSRQVFRLLFGRRLPVTSGTLALAGLCAPIRIDRDQWGIPHVEVANDHDAWFALGFCHGQDRAFQVESIVRVSRGTLAELVGPKGLPVDRLSRRVGFHRAAQRQYEVISDEARHVVDAFAAGVSAGVTRGLPRKPHEFSILGGQPTPWTGVDVLAFAKLQSFVLPSNWDAELARLQILMADGPEALLALDPSATPEYPVRGLTNLQWLQGDVTAFREFMPGAGGSNNWVIGPQRSANGRPLVCNDPHLFPSLPGPWYLAHIRTPDWSIAGATFTGSPGFAAGFNGHVGWGVTAGLIDNADLFLEEIGPDGRSVRRGSRFVECALRKEVIQVKGQAATTETVLETPLGPIVSPALAGEWPALSLSAIWLRPLPVRGFLFAPRVRTGEELCGLFEQWPALPLNLVYADTRGHFGWQIVGQAPRRRRGNGTVPTPAWLDDTGWHDDLIPFSEMPRAADPAPAFFATANNAPPGLENGPFLGVEWLDSYRRDAIAEAISSKSDWSVADCQKLQLDRRSLPWRELREVIVAAAPHFKDWDGRVEPDSAFAAVFELFCADMFVRIVKAKAPKSYRWLTGQTPCQPGINLFYLRFMGRLSRLLREQPKGWFKRPWPDEIRDALTASTALAAKRTWGQLHRLRPKHLLLGDFSPFKHIFSAGPIPFGGDAETINQGAVRPLDPTGETDNIAGMRMVVDVGNWSASRFVLCGGQSGNPLSPHYADLFELWQKGEGVPMPWTADEVREAARETLALNPA
jgi:penicillin amidase